MGPAVARGAATVTPSAAGTAVAVACPTVSGIQSAMNCVATPAAVKQPYAVGMADAQRYKNNDITKNGGLTNEQIKKATRGLPQSAVLGADFDKTTPTACIGPDVFFNEVKNSGIASGETTTASLAISKAVALCDPFGLKPAIQTGANTPLPGAATQADGPVPSAAATFAANALYYSGANAGQDGV